MDDREAGDAGRRAGVAGLGVIGLRVARLIDEGTLGGLTLSAVSSRDREKATAAVASFQTPPSVVANSELGEHSDIVVDCTPAAIFREVAEPAIDRGACLVTISAAALLDHMDLVERASATGAQIIVPTGAIIGLDTVRAMAVGEIRKVMLETRKPPNGLAGAPYLVANDISVDGLVQPLRVFEGSARAAARGFPANVNVAAALALAGIGPDLTKVEVWADPNIDRNVQSVTISSDSGDATMTIRNIPSPENPKTGRIVAQSIIAALARHTSPLVVGS